MRSKTKKATASRRQNRLRADCEVVAAVATINSYRHPSRNSERETRNLPLRPTNPSSVTLLPTDALIIGARSFIEESDEIYNDLVAS